MKNSSNTPPKTADATIAQGVVHEIRSAVNLYFSPLRAAARITAQNIRRNADESRNKTQPPVVKTPQKSFKSKKNTM